jgi:hypothetical protein
LTTSTMTSRRSARFILAPLLVGLSKSGKRVREAVAKTVDRSGIVQGAPKKAYACVSASRLSSMRVVVGPVTRSAYNSKCL